MLCCIMSKNGYTRYSMRENMLKKVLIRIDYDGVTDINKWIELIKTDDLIKKKFNDYNRVSLNKASLDLSRMEEVAEQRALPLAAFSSQPLHRFYESKFEGRQDSVTMEIASLFMTFQINCKSYSNMDVYRDYITEYIEKFLQFDQFIKIKRIGIRKIGGVSDKRQEDIKGIFEGRFFTEHAIDREEIYLIEREFSDKFMKTIHLDADVSKLVKINYSTLCRHQDSSDTYQAILDIDGYIDEFIIKQNELEFPRDFKSSIEIVNDYLFELYKKSVTEKYLSEHGQEERK